MLNRERQCRELWKLRATLHDDSCDLDDWSNYHQRLNKRYDSGYKSLEQQLSSSLEGGALLVQDQTSAIKTNNNNNNATSSISEQPERPKSGCSRLIDADPKKTIDLDSKSLLDEQELLLHNSGKNNMQTSRIDFQTKQKCQFGNDSIGYADDDHFLITSSSPHSGRDSKCSILSEHSAKMQIALNSMVLDEQGIIRPETLLLMNSNEERQHLLPNSNDESSMRVDLTMTDYCDRNSANSSRNSNEPDATKQTDATN